MRVTYCGLLVVLICASSLMAEDKSPLDGLFPPEVAALVKSPATVTAYRLSEGSTYRAKVADYKTMGDPVDVDGETKKQLAEVLIDPRAYLWDVAKGCDPLYGVRLEFKRKNETVDVVFCFECSILSVYRQGEAVASEDFDPIRPPLVAVMKKIFPKDGEIQSLNPRSP
jgi:hypothetical protein